MAMKVAFMLFPRAVKPTTTVATITEAIKPYSKAVTARRSLASLERMISRRTAPRVRRSNIMQSLYAVTGAADCRSVMGILPRLLAKRFRKSGVVPSLILTSPYG